MMTRYDEMRFALRDKMDECLKEARKLAVGDDIWGYDEMKDDYAFNVYQAIKKARDLI